MAANKSTVEWRDVPGYEGVYSVSNKGAVRRIGGAPHTRMGRVIFGWTDPKGYVRVRLITEGKFMHHVVAEAFIGRRPPGMEINHKNGVKHDNRVENLEWVTRSYNIVHRMTVLGQKATFGQDHPAAKLTDRDVRRIREIRKNRSMTIVEVAKKFGVGTNAIDCIVSGKRWSHVR